MAGIPSRLSPERKPIFHRSVSQIEELAAGGGDEAAAAEDEESQDRLVLESEDFDSAASHPFHDALASLAEPGSGPASPSKRAPTLLRRSLENLSDVIGQLGRGQSSTFNISTLVELKLAFDSADADGSGALDLQEFIQAMHDIRSFGQGMSDQQINHLFMSIDANSDGTVDWDEFTNYILLQQMSQEDDIQSPHQAFVRQVPAASKRSHRARSPEKPGRRPGRVTPDSLAEDRLQAYQSIVQKVEYIPSLKAYVAATQDGLLRLWNAGNLQPQAVLRNSRSWITDTAYSPTGGLAVFALDRSITLYTANRKSLDLQGRLINVAKAPMCGTWLREQEQDKLLYGDDKGGISAYTVPQKWGDAPELREQTALDLICQPLCKLHTGWVTKLKWINHAAALISTSLDGNLALLDLEKRKAKWTAVAHSKGVYSAEYSRSYNFIATCGLERTILIWNPFTAKSLNALQGHTSSVLDVVMNEADSQLMSLGADKCIKVWDVRTNHCIQTISMYAQTPTTVSTIHYNPEKRALVVGGLGLQQWLHSEDKEQTRSTICTALYNPDFHQVVVAEVDSLVTVFDVTTGECVFAFSANVAKADADLAGLTSSLGQLKVPAGAEERDTLEDYVPEESAASRGRGISSLAFDVTGRKLLVGYQDGSIRMWNFNNGACLKKFEDFGEAEVSCMTSVLIGKEHYVVASGWNRKLCIWEDHASRASEKQYRSVEGHTDDVSSMVRCPPQHLATGGYDGKVIVWRVDGVIKAVLRPLGYDTMTAEERPIRHLAFHERLQVLLVASADETLRMWSIVDATIVHEVKVYEKGQAGPLCFGSDGQTLYTSDSRGYITQWDMSSFKPPRGTVPRNFDRSSTGSLACLPSNAKQRRQDASAVVAMGAIRAHSDAILAMTAIASADSGDFLVTAAADGTCRLWTSQCAPVGQFGTGAQWNIGDPSTFGGVSIDSAPRSRSTNSTWQQGAQPHSSKGGQVVEKAASRASPSPLDGADEVSGTDGGGASSCTETREGEGDDDDRGRIAERVAELLGSGPLGRRRKLVALGSLHTMVSRRLEIKELSPMPMAAPRNIHSPTKLTGSTASSPTRMLPSMSPTHALPSMSDSPTHTLPSMSPTHPHHFVSPVQTHHPAS